MINNGLMVLLLQDAHCLKQQKLDKNRLKNYSRVEFLIKNIFEGLLCVIKTNLHPTR
jgi:hypothetical protein